MTKQYTNAKQRLLNKGNSMVIYSVCWMLPIRRKNKTSWLYNLHFSSSKTVFAQNLRVPEFHYVITVHRQAVSAETWLIHVWFIEHCLARAGGTPCQATVRQKWRKNNSTLFSLFSNEAFTLTHWWKRFTNERKLVHLEELIPLRAAFYILQSRHFFDVNWFSDSETFVGRKFLLVKLTPNI